MGTLHEDRYTCFVLSRSVIVRMRSFSDKICRENQNTHFLFYNVLKKIPVFMRKCRKIL